MGNYELHDSLAALAKTIDKSADSLRYELALIRKALDDLNKTLESERKHADRG